MTTTLEVTIWDDKWPKLRIVCRRQTTSGEATITQREILYDQSLAMFETHLTNHLRPMVQELIQKRKAQQLLRS